MIETIIGFYSKSAAIAQRDPNDTGVARELRWRKWSVFLSITAGYGFYYVCRLSFSVAKKPMADAGVFDAAQMGLIGSTLFFAYAFGKLTNGILADRVNVRAFMSTGLLLSAIINLILGFTDIFWVFAVLWGLNGWFQSFGAPSSVVTISHWFSGKERGSIYGMWSSSHNIGEAVTFIGTALVITAVGWMCGFRVAGICCLIMCFFVWKFHYERPEVYGLQSASEDRENIQPKSIGAKQWEVVKTLRCGSWPSRVPSFM